MSSILMSSSECEYILSPKAIRDQAQKIFERSKKGQTHFAFFEEKLEPTVDYVMSVIENNYPSRDIPFHSRWGHFRAGGIDRAFEFKSKIKHLDPLEQARCQLDLVITSVLLDAGAGVDWSYFEESSQKKFNRSEGLGVASYYMFLSGCMDSEKKLRANAEGLKSVTRAELEKHFQVSDKNPLVGAEGRVQLLNNLARSLENKEIFNEARPGHILDYLLNRHGRKIKAVHVLEAVLKGFGSIWPGRLQAKVHDHLVNLGDVWIYPPLAESESKIKALVPFHKLSQWMTYSLIEPIREAGIEVSGVEELTGLAEYRNGGLMMDSGLIQLRNPELAKKAWAPDSELIIEWRALTIVLLDLIGERVQKKLGQSAEDFPLAKVLEGGTWWAGRGLAQKLRVGAVPPLNIMSDGTVF